MKDTFKRCCGTLVGANCNSPFQREAIRPSKGDNSPFKGAIRLPSPPIETIHSGDSNKSWRRFLK
jgi:hypothetical protein